MVPANWPEALKESGAGRPYSPELDHFLVLPTLGDKEAA
jgi:hypothetical protein